MAQKANTLGVLKKVISLEMSKGHLKWKVTDLARLSRVRRELIYYHFGDTKKAILERSMELIAEEFYGLTPERTALLKGGGLLESLRITAELARENPSIALFYFKWRTAPSPLQKKYLEIESRYEARLSALFPHLSQGEVEALHAIFHGLVTAPFLTDAGLLCAVRWVESILARK